MRRRPRQRAAVPTSLASARSNLSRLTTLPSPQPPFLRRVVTIYSSANATTPATMKQKYVVGPLPDMVAWNHDCTKIAVANEGEGVYTDDGLVPPPSLRACLSPTPCPTPLRHPPNSEKHSDYFSSLFFIDFFFPETPPAPPSTQSI